MPDEKPTVRFIRDEHDCRRFINEQNEAPAPAAQPMSLGEQVAHAQREVASWSDEKRRSVQLEGENFRKPAPAAQPLTDEQIAQVARESVAVWVTAEAGSQLHDFARAIERAHGITE